MINIKKILSLFIFLFVFHMFNKTLNTFIDLRIVIIILGLIILIYNILEVLFRKRRLTYKKNEFKNANKIYVVCLFVYIGVFFSNISWGWNGLIRDDNIYKNLLILNIFNFVSISVIYFNLRKIKINKVVKYIMISGIVLVCSMVLIWAKFDLSMFVTEGNRLETVGFSVLGINRRISGFSEDPNYTSLNCMIIFYLSRYLIKDKKKKVILCGIGIVGYLLSFSKTVFMFIIAIELYNFMKKKCIYSKVYILIEKITVASLYIIPVMVVKFDYISFSSSTMIIRYNMWKEALKLWEKNVLLGSGLSSARSNFAYSAYHGWYVQTHSTIFQLISEHGLITFGLFIILLIIMIKKNYFTDITLLVVGLSITSEIMYLQYIPFMIMIHFLINCVKDTKENYISI